MEKVSVPTNKKSKKAGKKIKKLGKTASKELSNEDDLDIEKYAQELDEKYSFLTLN